MQKFNFSTVGIAIYSLGGNDWYAVEQDDKKVLLVDTDCKIGDKELRTPWSEANENSPEVENGQCILNYCNSIADTYFGNIKYAIVPRTVEAGTCRTENALMWPMSYDEFKSACSVSDIGDKIAENSGSDVWTRSLVNVFFNGRRYVWKINRVNEYFEGDHAGKSCGVAPAFYLKKSAIDRVTRSGRIILRSSKNLRHWRICRVMRNFRKWDDTNGKRSNLTEKKCLRVLRISSMRIYCGVKPTKCLMNYISTSKLMNLRMVIYVRKSGT